jgi:hypothetical protein
VEVEPSRPGSASCGRGARSPPCWTSGVGPRRTAPTARRRQNGRSCGVRWWSSPSRTTWCPDSPAWWRWTSRPNAPTARPWLPGECRMCVPPARPGRSPGTCPPAARRRDTNAPGSDGPESVEHRTARRAAPLPRRSGGRWEARARRAVDPGQGGAGPDVAGARVGTDRRRGRGGPALALGGHVAGGPAALAGAGARSGGPGRRLGRVPGLGAGLGTLVGPSRERRQRRPRGSPGHPFPRARAPRAGGAPGAGDPDGRAVVSGDGVTDRRPERDRRSRRHRPTHPHPRHLLPLRRRRSRWASALGGDGDRGAKKDPGTDRSVPGAQRADQASACGGGYARRERDPPKVRPRRRVQSGRVSRSPSRSPPRRSSRSQARARFQSLCTVRTETSRAAAVSSSERPAK